MKRTAIVIMSCAAFVIGCEERTDTDRADTAPARSIRPSESREATRPGMATNAQQATRPLPSTATEREFVRERTTQPGMDTNQASQTQPGAQATQQQLQMRIRQTLAQGDESNQKLLSQEQIQQIQIETQNGQVTLKGKVPSEELKTQIEAQVKKVEGVRSVKNELEVNGQ